MKFRPAGLNIDSFFCEHLNGYKSDAFNASLLLKVSKYNCLHYQIILEHNACKSL